MSLSGGACGRTSGMGGRCAVWLSEGAVKISKLQQQNRRSSDVRQRPRNGGERKKKNEFCKSPDSNACS